MSTENDHEFLVLVQRYRREENAAAAAKIKELRDIVDTYEAQAVRAEALLEGTERQLQRHISLLKNERTRRDVLDIALRRALALLMFGVLPDGPPADRVGALHYLRTHGLPEATPADLDAACEGLETPWGSGPIQGCNGCAWAIMKNNESRELTSTSEYRCVDHGLSYKSDIDF